MVSRKGSPTKGKKPAPSAGKENSIASAKKMASKRAMDDGKKLPIASPPQSPRQSPLRRNYTRDGMQDRKSLTPWMTGGNMMRAPTKPKLTVPNNWTTMSGRFRPSESGWGFDARSTVGRLTSFSVFSGQGGGGGASFVNGVSSYFRVSRRDLDSVEIEDAETSEAFRKDLEEKGMKQTIVVDKDWELRSNISVVSMSDASYILDLAQQKQFRAQERQEEALEEAFILYKTALAEGASDDEEMFFMLLTEVKKELDEKYRENDRKNDKLLDKALEAEMKRRERKELHGSEHSDGVDVGKKTNKLRELLGEEELYLEVEDAHKLDHVQNFQRLVPDSKEVREVEYTRSSPTHSKTTNSSTMNVKKSSGLFSCCGKDVEDSVVIATGPTVANETRRILEHRDPSFFKRLRKKQAEQEETNMSPRRKQVGLSDDDMWWQNKSIEINVPDIEDDTVPSNPSARTEPEQIKSAVSQSSNESPRSRKSEPMRVSQRDLQSQEEKQSPLSRKLSRSPAKKERTKSNPTGGTSKSSSRRTSKSISSMSEESFDSPRKKHNSPKKKSTKKSRGQDADSADSDKDKLLTVKGKKSKSAKSSNDLRSPKGEGKAKMDSKSKNTKKSKNSVSLSSDSGDSSHSFEAKVKKRKKKKSKA